MNPESLLSHLSSGAACRFVDWPNTEIPAVTAGVYTIWEQDAFLYVGMAGRGMTAQIDPEQAPTRIRGLRDRLNSHASGRRSGDQFCVYVCDRLVLPTLRSHQITEIGKGALSLDGLVKQYIHERLAYRYVQTPDGAAARSLERDIQRGALEVGKPRLNPL